VHGVLCKQQQQQQEATGNSEAGDERCGSSDAAAMEVERSPELQRLYDELVASKLCEAEAHLSMKEFEQKLLQLQRNWQASMFSFSRVLHNMPVCLSVVCQLQFVHD